MSSGSADPVSYTVTPVVLINGDVVTLILLATF